MPQLLPLVLVLLRVMLPTAKLVPLPPKYEPRLPVLEAFIVIEPKAVNEPDCCCRP